MEVARLTAVINVQTARFRSQMKAVDAQMASTAAQARRMDGATTRSAAGFGRVGASAKVASASLKTAKWAMVGIAGAAFLGTREIIAEDKALAAIRNTLRSTGNAAGTTVGHLEKMAGTMQRQTGLQDDVILSAQNLLLTFTKISNNNADRMFDKAVKATADLSIQFGKELPQAAIMVGKALNDPTKGMTALGRAGIQFTKQQKEQIKTLQESGNVLGAQRMIMKELQVQVGGAARTFGQTRAGQLERLKRGFEELTESIAVAVLPALMKIGPQLVALGKDIAPAIAAMVGGIASIASPIARMIAGLASNRAGVIALTVAFGGFLALGLAAKVAGMVTALTGLAKATALAGGAAAATSAMGGAAGGAASKVGLLGSVLPAVMNPLGLLAVAAGATVAGLLMFGKRTDYAAESAAAMAKATTDVRNSVVATSDAMAAVVQGTLRVTSTSTMATEAKRKEAEAVRAYNSAVEAGRGPGETEAAFQQRLAGLYNAVATARLNSAQATGTSNAAVRQAADAAVKLGDASKGEIETAQKRKQVADNYLRTAQSFGMGAAETSKRIDEQRVATAALVVAEAKRADRLKEVERTQVAARNAIKNSTMADGEKAAQLEIVNRAINKTRTEQKRLSDTPVKSKITADNSDATKKARDTVTALLGVKDRKVKVSATDQATSTLNPLKSLLDNLRDKNINVTATATKRGNGGFIPGWFRGGFVGYAAGGQVRGPGGVDRVPAMLTAGEVVLTKKQQGLVDGGMSIREALVRTGGAFAGGGVVGLGARLAQSNKTLKNRDRELKAAKKSKDAGRIKKAQKAYDDAKKVNDNLKRQKSERMSAMEPAFQAAGDAIKDAGLARFDRETAGILQKVERGFTTTVTGSFGTFTGSMKEAERFAATSLKNIEKNFAGVMRNSAGQVVATNVSFKTFDKMMKDAQSSLTKMYDALTPAEQRLKDLQETGAADDIQRNIQDAQAKLSEAQRWGDPAAEAEAQKALDDARRAELVAGLTKDAEAERAEQERKRAEAQEAFDEEWATRRENLQGQLDYALQQQEDHNAALQQAMSDALALRLQQEEDTRAAERVGMEQHYEAKAAALMASRKDYLDHFADVRDMTNRFANRMRRAGANIGKSIAEGLDASKGELKGAAAGLANLLSDFLKTQSPTKKGPMSDLNHWWDGLAPALTQGLDTREVEQALRSATAMPGIGASGGGGGSMSINLTVNDSTFAGMSRDQADRVAREIQAAIERQVTISV